MTRVRPLYHGPPAALLLLAAFLPGCGGGRDTAPVSGTVTFNGERLASGTVALMGDDGRTVSAMIREDGTYSIPNAPVGPVKATVQTFQPPPSVVPPDAPAKSVPRPALRYVPLPKHYSNMERSGLTHTIEPGNNTFDIRLKK